MPPKRKTEPEPTDRATRSKSNTEKPAPKYTYSSEEDLPEESFNPNIDLTSTGNLPRIPAHLLPPVVRRSYSPTEFDTPIRGDETTNKTLFHSVQEDSDMATDNEASDDEVETQALPPGVTEGISKEMIAMMAFISQQTAQNLKHAAKQAEKQRKQDQKQHLEALAAHERSNRENQARAQQHIDMLADQIARMTSGRNDKQKGPIVKLPMFDIDKDHKSFPQWRERWNGYLVAHGLTSDPADDENEEKLMTYLKSSLTDNTLRWLKHQDISEEDRKSTEKILNIFDEHIKESTNPIVAVVELLTMKRYPSESADHLNARIQDKLNQCEFSKVTDFREYMGFLATMVAVEHALRKRMFLDKTDSYAKARIAVKADEQATANSKLSNSNEASAHATSTYKKDQKTFRQNFNPEQNFKQDQHSSRGRSEFRGQYSSRGQSSARVGYQGRNHDGRPERDPSQSRGRSESRGQDGKSQSRPEAPCFRCGRSHAPDTCWAKDKTCDNCQRIGHIAPACKQPKKVQTQHHVASSNSVEGDLGTVQAAPSRVSKLKSLYEPTAESTANRQIHTIQAIPLYTVRDLEPLESVDIEIMPAQNRTDSFTISILPDSGANVTAVEEEDAKSLKLDSTSIILKGADGGILNTIGMFKATLSRHGNFAEEDVYVVKGLSKPLLSRRMLKELGAVNTQFPHHQWYNAANHRTSNPQPQYNAQAASQSTVKDRIKQFSPEPKPVPNQSTLPKPSCKPTQIRSCQVNVQEQSQHSDLHETNQVSNIPRTHQATTGHGPEFDLLFNEFADLFTGKCTPMKEAVYHIELEPDVKPINYGSVRNVAEPNKAKLKLELEALIEQGIIEKIEYPTPWLHPIVVVAKKGTSDIRLCVDYTNLNKAIRRPVNPEPTPWETIRNLPKDQSHFAVFDALKGYHQILLDEESRDLTAFMTPFGRHRYLRVPFGMSSAGDVFTLHYGKAIDEATDGLRATEDTLLRASTTAELLQKTRRFFTACRVANITLNQKKIQWDKSEVLFGGYQLSQNGYKLDPALNRALAEFPIPKNATDVRSFHGLANQLAHFSDEIAFMLAPLKTLLKKGIQFLWLPEHQTAFLAAREHLASEKVLAYYCPKKQTRLIADASRLNGLGFVLKQLQENDQWRTVQAGSRFLTSAETRYAMCELEMLAIAWACQKCAMFVEGLPRSRFEIWTDHQPLVPILDKQSLPDITNKRLQRLKMKVEHLTFTTQWIKGEENIEADTLSRHPWARANETDEIDEDVFVAEEMLLNFVEIEIQDPEAAGQANHISPDQSGSQAAINIVEIKDQRLEELKQFSCQDELYQKICQYVTTGFPEVISALIPDDERPYYAAREELLLDSENLLCKGNQLVVPSNLVKTYLSRLHGMHQGASKMLARARTSLWWPYMTRDVNNHAKSCQTCEEYKPSNKTEKVLTHQKSHYPFQYVHMDLGQVEGKFYLISVDQYSGYPHIHTCGSTAKTSQVIDATINLITHFSIPEAIYTDGGPQFLKDGQFAAFCKDWGIQHVQSSPYMPRSNGIAEVNVKEMKKLIRANISTNGVLDRASTLNGLLTFRNTPRAGTGKSPAELIFGQPIRDSLPMRRDQLLPMHRYHTEARLFEHEERKKPDADRYGPTAELPLLKPHTPVRIQDPITKRWTKTGCIVNFGSNTREYLVKVGHDTIRRNRKFLKPIEIEATPPTKQPAQPPMLTKRKTTVSFSDEEDKDEENPDRFHMPAERRTATSSSEEETDEEDPVLSPMQTQRGTPGPSGTAQFKTLAQRKTSSLSDSARYQTPAKRRTAKSSSDEEEEVFQHPNVAAQPQIIQPPRPRFLSLPNSQPLGTRTVQPSEDKFKSFNRPNDRRQRLSSTSSTSSNSGQQIDPTQDPNQWLNYSTWPTKPPNSNSKNWRQPSTPPQTPTRPRPSRGQPAVNYRDNRAYSKADRKADLKFAQAFYRDLEKQIKK